jgi:hypothetical protein
VAVGPSILVISYSPLTRQTSYQDLGAQYFEERERAVIERRLIRHREAFGHKDILEPIAA